jgi:hypothetical protein
MSTSEDLWESFDAAAAEQPPPGTTGHTDDLDREVRRERNRREARRRIDEEQATEDVHTQPSLIADVHDLPTSFDGTRATLSQEDVETAMRTRPVTLFDALRMARVAKAKPELLQYDADPGALLYRGKSNGLSGESGEGKSTVAKLACYIEARRGTASLYIDREKDVTNFAETMVEFGDLTDAQAALIFYWNPTRSTAALMPVILGFIKKYDIDLVVIDSVSRDLAVWGPTANENDNNDVRRWYNSCVDPILRIGATALLLDHVVKPGADFGGRSAGTESLYAKGAAAKREVLTGIALMMRPVKSFSKYEAGWAKLVCAKDNNGTFAKGQVVAEFHVTPGLCRSSFGLRPSSQPVDEQGKAIPTVLMQRVSEYLQTATEPVSRNKVLSSVSGKEASLGDALDRLVSGGHATEQPGPHNGRYYLCRTPYQSGSNPGVTSAASSGFGGGAAAASWAAEDPF